MRMIYFMPLVVRCCGSGFNQPMFLPRAVSVQVTLRREPLPAGTGHLEREDVSMSTHASTNGTWVLR